jgi:hypothetical protein
VRNLTRQALGFRRKLSTRTANNEIPNEDNCDISSEIMPACNINIIASNDCGDTRWETVTMSTMSDVFTDPNKP